MKSNWLAFLLKTAGASSKVLCALTMTLIFLFYPILASAQQSIVKVDSFYAAAVKLQLKFTAILPANYAKETKRYPVVYLLHGYSGNYTSWISYAQLPVSLATRYNCIIILPDGGNSWYVNWTGQTDGKPHQWENMLVKDLVPFIDSKFRTINKKSARIIGGLSMGGYGALAVGLKNHHLFGFVFSSAGAINFCKNIKDEMVRDTLDWNSPQLWSDGEKTIDVKNFSTQKQRTPQGLVFKTTKDADVYDPYILLKKTEINQLPFIHIDCGNADDFLKDAFEFVSHLKLKTKQYSFITFSGEHEVPYWQRAIEHVFLVMKDHQYLE
jgi:putative tributyrin esterase